MPGTKAAGDAHLASPGTPWWFLLGLYLLGLVFLGALARQVTGPLDVDGAYYFLVARNVATGRGMVIDALWHFFPPAEIPQPAGDLWMPLPSLLMAPALLLGQTFRDGQAVQVLLAALLPLLAYRIARDEGAGPRWATLGGLITLFAGTVTVHWLDTDCFTTYALAGGAALYAMGRSAGDSRWLAAGGLLGGLAAVTRNDGVLLLAVLWAQALLVARRERRQPAWNWLLLGSALFLLPVLLWEGRNLLAFGRSSPVPPAFFLTMRDYRHLFDSRPTVDWSGFWRQGLGTFVSLRLAALKASLTVLLADLQVWAILPLAVALAGLRRRPALWPAFLYLPVLFLVLNGAFPLLVQHGTWSRSLSAFLPAGFACTALGLQRTVERLLHWRPALPSRLLHSTLLTLGAGVTLLMGGIAIQSQFRSAIAHPAAWQQIGNWLAANTATGDVVMAQDPMAILLYAGRPGVGVPYEELPLLLDLARSYRASRLVLLGHARTLLPPNLQDLYEAGSAQEPGFSQGPFTLLWRQGESQIYGLW